MLLSRLQYRSFRCVAEKCWNQESFSKHVVVYSVGKFNNTIRISPYLDSETSNKSGKKYFNSFI